MKTPMASIKKTPTLTLVTLIILAMTSFNTQGQTTTPKQWPQPTKQWSQPAIPTQRDFSMGFTTFPYDTTSQAVDDTATFINQHGDMITIHNDHGVPWPEALEGLDNYHPNLLGDIAGTISRIDPNNKIYVSATPQSTMRNDEIALYWGDSTNMPPPSAWANKPIDDPDVIAAYLNWCRFLIAQFNPDYFAYGIEVNGGFNSTTDPKFLRFERFLQGVYPTLKTEYPNLPIFLSVLTSNFAPDNQTFFDTTAALLNYSDWVGISSYPYFRYDISSPNGITTAGHPNEIPQNLFSNIRNLAPNKPVAITETGYPAQDLILNDLAIYQPGTPLWQAMYVHWLMDELQSMNAQFVVWFLHRDHDMLNDRFFPKGTSEPALLIWRDTGLLDENGVPRLGLTIWDHWLTIPSATK